MSQIITKYPTVQRQLFFCCGEWKINKTMQHFLVKNFAQYFTNVQGQSLFDPIYGAFLSYARFQTFSFFSFETNLIN